jgi:hypothetical protein
MAGRNEGIIVTNGTISATQIAVGRGASNTLTQTGHGEDLQALLRTLTELLRQTPAEKSEEAEAVAAQAAQLVEAAGKEKPNRTMLQVLASGLKQAASFLKEAVPDAVTIAGQIASVVARLHGLSL